MKGNGTKITRVNCDTNDLNQNWFIANASNTPPAPYPGVRLANVATQTCITISNNGNQTNGTLASGGTAVVDAPAQGYPYVQVWSFDDPTETNQFWYFQNSEDGSGYIIQNGMFNTCLQVVNNGTTALLQTANCNTSDPSQVFVTQGFSMDPSQLFNNTNTAASTFEKLAIVLISAASGECVTMPNGNQVNGSSYTGSSNNGFVVYNNMYGTCLQAVGSVLQHTYPCNESDPTQVFIAAYLSSYAGYDIFTANARFVEDHNRAADQEDAAAAAAAGCEAPTAAGDTPPVAAAAAGGNSNATTTITKPPTPKFKLTVNRYASMSRGRFFQTRTGRTVRDRTTNRTSIDVYKRRMSDAELPPSLDYRGTRMDGPGVKDQAWCQSCWVSR
ncbi:hypothetical protein PLESTB_001301000 [Pleodorina starrii]|uniref:Uncharacterized protein n=1 Tax=Pleodorina starrii TaxID=330485 RepID=A0A9W6BTK1_9CHLO|nr:hypothetical protein PLESTB_001301000 [Pleodorina starrii]